jgi:hypothetical protein
MTVEAIEVAAVVPETILVTDTELDLARQDPASRQRLVGKHLELLLGELKRLRALSDDEAHARQIREGLELAGRLTDLLQVLSRERPRPIGTAPGIRA